MEMRHKLYVYKLNGLSYQKYKIWPRCVFAIKQKQGWIKLLWLTHTPHWNVNSEVTFFWARWYDSTNRAEHIQQRDTNSYLEEYVPHSKLSNADFATF